MAPPIDDGSVPRLQSNPTENSTRLLGSAGSDKVAAITWLPLGMIRLRDMRPSSSRSLLVALLAFSLVFGMGLSGLQAGDMTSTMLTATDTGISVPVDCDGCCDNDDGLAACECVLQCIAGNLVVLLAQKVDVKPPTEDRAWLPESSHPSRIVRPEPEPPKTTILS